MKILQVGSSLRDWGGIERYITFLTQGLLDRGHEVHVACPAGSPLDKRCAGIHHAIEQKKQFSLSSLGGYRALFATHRFNVVHIHFSPDFIVPANAARAGKQPCLIMTRHLAEPWNGLKSWNYSRTFDHIIGVSDAVRQSLIHDSGIAPEKVSVAKAGVPAMHPTVQRTEARKRLGIEEGTFAVGFFGRLTIEKGADYLMRAAATLPDNIEVHIFGEGPQEAELKAMPSDPHVKLQGFVPDVADAMNAMDVIAIPSWWAEAFPYAALEGMSMGKPIIASRVGGLPEQVEEGETGLLVPPKDEAALSAAILELSRDPERCARFGRKAQWIHGETYTVEAFAERVERVYRQAIGKV